MKGDISRVLPMVFTLFLLCSSLLSTAEGKCRGKWASHMCWGGNGKRSDPNMAQANPSLLRQLLLRTAALDVPPEVLREPSLDLGLSFPQDAELAPPFDTSLTDYSDNSLTPSIDRLTALLRTLRTLQKENDAIP